MMGNDKLDFLRKITYTDTFINVNTMLYIMLGWIVLVWAGIYFVGRKREF